ncbi:PadR family transcriptional regulator [Candidatus Woesearchaeota archaeon]|nr:PadR family transcriptional regulator [Candidatus Woesearchaeota archaeon]
MKIEIGSLVKFYIILLLNEGQKHGYTLMKELEEKLNRKISASQVYPFLKILKKNKLIKIEVIKEREKKVYKLTSKGKEFVNNFLHKSGNLLAAVIESKISSCAHCECKIYESNYKEKINGKLLIFCCEHCAKSFKHCKKH